MILLQRDNISKFESGSCGPFVLAFDSFKGHEICSPWAEEGLTRDVLTYLYVLFLFFSLPFYHNIQSHQPGS